MLFHVILYSSMRLSVVLCFYVVLCDLVYCKVCVNLSNINGVVLRFQEKQAHGLILACNTHEYHCFHNSYCDI